MRIYYTCPQGPNTIVKERDWKWSAAEGGETKYKLLKLGRGISERRMNLPGYSSSAFRKKISVPPWWLSQPSHCSQIPIRIL